MKKNTAYLRQGDGPVVVLIHGMGLSRAMWQWQLPALAPHFSVVTYDLLGHGESRALTGPCTLSQLSEQVRELLDTLEVEQASIVGFSLGGMIARRFVIDHPQRVTSLGVLHSAHDRSDEERAGLLSRLLLVQENPPSTTVDAALDRWYTPDFRQANPHMMHLIREWMSNNDATDYARVYEVLATGDRELVDGLSTITCPTLLVSAEQDYGNSPAMAYKMAELIPHAEIVIHKGLRHMALAEAPDVFNPPLVNFLRSATRLL